MIHKHESTRLAGTPGALRLRHGEPARLRATQAGELRVRGGLVWVTRRGDLEDRFLGDGERLALARGDEVVVEPWRHGSHAELQWQAGSARHRSTRAVRALAVRALFARWLAGLAGLAGLQRAPQRSM